VQVIESTAVTVMIDFIYMPAWFVKQMDKKIFICGGVSFFHF